MALVEAADPAQLLERVSREIEGKPHLQFFCTPKTLARYLKARNMNLDKAAKMLLDTLKWRDAENLHEISWQEVKELARTGKVFRAVPLTKAGRPILHMRPRFENNVVDQTANVRHFTYQMEMITRYADEVSPDGKITVIIDYTDFTTAKNPPLKTSIAVLKILQHHHPERLHEALLWHPPRMFSILWKALSPFVDHVTHQKMVFFEKKSPTSAAELAQRMDVSHLDKCLGGTEEDTFDFEKYGVRMEHEEAAYKEALTKHRHAAAIGGLLKATTSDGISEAAALQAAAAGATLLQ